MVRASAWIALMHARTKEDARGLLEIEVLLVVHIGGLDLDPVPAFLGDICRLSRSRSVTSLWYEITFACAVGSTDPASPAPLEMP